jgi:hypothetical protein
MKICGLESEEDNLVLIAMHEPEDDMTTSMAHAAHRYGLMEKLIKRGGFTPNEALVAVCGHPGDRCEIERRVAKWLTNELHRSGALPVRRVGSSLSPLHVADIAIAMLDYDWPPGKPPKPPPTPELIGLLAELVGVTRHRKAFANPHRGRKFSMAARLDGAAALRGEKLTVRRLAKLTSVSVSTVSAWRRNSAYKHLVELEKRKPFLDSEPPHPSNVPGSSTVR